MKVSVIVPVYGVEKYLDACVESIVNQTYKDIEIILVDDGSPDNCPQMCDEWGKKDDRIIVIHKENGGLSDARNAGVAVSTGEYIGFVDSDDYIEPNMYEVLVSAIIKNNADIAMCGYNYVDEKGKIKQINYCADEDEVLTDRDVFNKISGESNYSSICCNRLYKKEIAHKIKFPVGKIHEDEFTAHLFYGECQKIVCCKDILYNYLCRENSITQRKFSIRNLDAVEAFVERYYYFKEKTLFSAAKYSLKGAYGRLAYGFKMLPPHEGNDVLNKHFKTVFKLLIKEKDVRVIKLGLIYLFAKLRRLNIRIGEVIWKKH